MKILQIIGSATPSNFNVKIHSHEVTRETDKTYIAGMKTIHNVRFTNVHTNFLNVRSVHYSITCLANQRDQAIELLRAAIVNKATENFKAVSDIMNRVNEGMNIIEPGKDVLPESGDIKI